MHSKSSWLTSDDRTKFLEYAENKTIIWDFDGVVADTEPVQWDSFRVLLNKSSFVPDELFHETLMGHTEPVIWEKLFKMGAPVQDIDRLMAERSEIYVEMAKRVLSPSWIAAELMPIFAEIANKQYVISNGNRVNNVALLENWDLLSLVDVVDRGKTTKAELFKYHALASPSIVFEDNESYALIAKNSGAFVVGVLHSLSLTQELSADITVKI